MTTQDGKVWTKMTKGPKTVWITYGLWYEMALEDTTQGWVWMFRTPNRETRGQCPTPGMAIDHLEREYREYRENTRGAA